MAFGLLIPKIFNPIDYDYALSQNSWND